MSRFIAWFSLVAALLAVVGWPILATVLAGFREISVASRGFLLAPVEGGEAVPRPLWLAMETARLVMATEALALPLGIVLALALFRADVPGRMIGLCFFAVSAFVPMPIHATAWLGAFGNVGRSQLFGAAPILVGWQGAAFVHAMAAVPWVVLFTGVGLLTVEPELEQSASLDHSIGWVIARITLRRSIGAIAGAGLAVAVLTAGDMTVTDLLQIRTYAEESYLQYNLGRGPGSAGAVALPPLVALGLLVGWGTRLLLRSDPERLVSSARRARVWPLGRHRLLAGVGFWLAMGFLVALPLYGLTWRAGRVGGEAALGQAPSWSLAGFLGTIRLAWEDSSRPLMTSAGLSALAATCAVALSSALAWRSRRPGPWRWVSAGSLAIALASPGPIAGMAFVLAYRSMPTIYDTFWIVVMAQIFRTFPYALLILWPAARSIPPEYLALAEVSGLGPAGQLWRVAWPLTRTAVLGAWGVAFVLALGELPATNLVTPPGLTPISVVIWGLMHTGVESHLSGVVLVMLVAVCVTCGLIGWRVIR